MFGEINILVIGLICLTEMAIAQLICMLQTWFISQKIAIDCGHLLRIAWKSSTHKKSVVTEPAKTKSKKTNKLDKTTAKVSSKGDKSIVKKHTNKDSKELEKKDVMMVRRSSFQKSLPCLRTPSNNFKNIFICLISLFHISKLDRYLTKIKVSGTVCPLLHIIYLCDT